MQNKLEKKGGENNQFFYMQEIYYRRNGMGSVSSIWKLAFTIFFFFLIFFNASFKEKKVKNAFVCF